MDVLIPYLQNNPVFGAVLALLIGLFIGSLFKKLIKAALFLGFVFLVGLYIAHDKASEEWRAQADVLLKKAEDAARAYGQDALEKGKDALEERLLEDH